ncbi:MAG: CDP-alcohol phosphatidyltransferase family protein [Solirubrobacterales bacterium]
MSEPERTPPSSQPQTIRTRRRIFGIDRSGPEPTATRAGQPLRPFTIPNMIGYARLAALPVFLYLAFDDPNGRDPVATAIFGVVAWGDYFDGMVARLTGQYSRLGALLDPVVDRLTVLCGAIVCFNFELLPRWLLIALGLRELVIPFLARFAITRGVDIEITWVGRIAAFLVFFSLFWAMVFDTIAFDITLGIGVAMAWAATLLYIKTGRERARAGDRAQPSSSG